VLADVSGHGEVVSAAADDLRHVLRLHIDDSDQSRLVQEINDSFLNDEHRIRYATALLLSFVSCSGELFFTNAGHLPPLHYRAAQAEWRFLHEATEGSGQIADLPLGLMAGMPYHQTGLQLDPGDLLVLYTDGINEAQNESAQQLGLDGLLSTVQGLPAHSVAAAGGELLARVAEFRGSALPQDDVTVVVLMRVGTD
jgi:serine phosphatase RsbU (regulator of sigma subunit)